jgi:hypothetical protein
MTKNFEHLNALDFISEEEKLRIQEQLEDAERTWKFSPVGCAGNCRTAIELLFTATGRSLKLQSSAESKTSTMTRIICHYESARRLSAAAGWRQIREQWRILSEVLHGEQSNAIAAKSVLREFYKATVLLVNELVPHCQVQPWCDPEDITDTHAAITAAHKRAIAELQSLSESALARVGEATESDHAKQVAVDRAMEAEATANAEIAELRAKLSVATKRTNDSETQRYKELLKDSEMNATKIALSRTQAEEERDLARKAAETANIQLDVFGAEIARLQTDAQSTASSLAETKAEIARIRRYPEEYPDFEEAASFFEESLLSPRAPMSPFIGVRLVSELTRDRFATRFQAILDGSACTIRIVRNDVDRDASNDCWDAWVIEAQNAAKLTGAPGGVGLASVLRTASKSHPGFIVLNRTNGIPLALAAGSNLHRSLPEVTSILDLFLRALQERESVQLFVLLPDADAVAIRGCAVTLLEPTAVHSGDLGPPEFKDVQPRAIFQLTQREMHAGWVFAAATIVGHLLPGTNTRGAIAFAAQRAARAYSNASIDLFADLIKRSLSQDPKGRPTLDSFRSQLASLSSESQPQ